MKIFITLIILFSLLNLSACKAQNINSKDGKTINAVKTAYKVSVNQRGGLVELSNTKNIMPTSGMRPPAKAPTVSPGDSKVDEVKIEAVVRSVLPLKRLHEIAKDRTLLLINFKTDSNGNLKEINFAISPTTTSITAAEIEQLEERLKKDIHITLNQRVYQGYNYVVVSRFVIFERLVNNEPKAVH